MKDLLKFKVKQLVHDKDYPENGTGIIEKVLKTRVHVKYQNIKTTWVYDKAHCVFLKQGRL